MSIVIVGGNERMAGQYVDICKEYGCKAKVFTKEKGSLRKKMGCPDLLILFTSTVSHKMVISASQEAKKIGFLSPTCIQAVFRRSIRFYRSIVSRPDARHSI